MGTSKGLSLAMAWLWGSTGLDLDTMKLYAALHNGADILKGVECDEKYPVSSSLASCKIFDWQADKMSLSFDDKELPKALNKEAAPETTQTRRVIDVCILITNKHSYSPELPVTA